MATINQKLAAIQQEKANIKSAIIDKGVEVGDKLTDYATAIRSISGSGSPSDPFVTKEFKSFVEAEELEYINRRGALLWTKDGVSEGTDGYLLANNGWDATHVEEGYTYWDPAANPFMTTLTSFYLPFTKEGEPSGTLVEWTVDELGATGLPGMTLEQANAFINELSSGSITDIRTIMFKDAAGTLAVYGTDYKFRENPTKTGYTLIGVCLGNGYWVRIGYAGLTTTKKWCQSSDGAYEYLESACRHSGWEITQYMRSENHPSYTDCIWNLINDSVNEPLWEHLYIPNWAELVQCCNLACDGGTHASGHTFNKNLGKLCSFGQDNYWSGSQYPYSDGSNNAFTVDFDDGGANDFIKGNFQCRSVALFHFGA